jgi:hypothetical protein
MKTNSDASNKVFGKSKINTHREIMMFKTENAFPLLQNRVHHNGIL